MLKHSIIAIGAGYLFLLVTGFFTNPLNQNLVLLFMFIGAGIAGYLSTSRGWLHGMLTTLLDWLIGVSVPILGFLFVIFSSYSSGLPVTHKGDESLVEFLLMIFTDVILGTLIIGIAGGFVGSLIRQKLFKK